MKKLSTLKSDAQKIVNKYIRLRDAKLTTGDTIFCKCISCGALKNSDEIEAGHFRAVSLSSKLRYLEENINAQCTYCNKYQHGNLAYYTIEIDKKWGEGTAEKLLNDHETKQWKRWELEELIKEFQKKIDLLTDEQWFQKHVLNHINIY